MEDPNPTCAWHTRADLRYGDLSILRKFQRISVISCARKVFLIQLLKRCIYLCLGSKICTYSCKEMTDLSTPLCFVSLAFLVTEWHRIQKWDIRSFSIAYGSQCSWDWIILFSGYQRSYLLVSYKYNDSFQSLFENAHIYDLMRIVFANYSGDCDNLRAFFSHHVLYSWPC